MHNNSFILLLLVEPLRTGSAKHKPSARIEWWYGSLLAGFGRLALVVVTGASHLGTLRLGGLIDPTTHAAPARRRLAGLYRLALVVVTVASHLGAL